MNVRPLRLALTAVVAAVAATALALPTAGHADSAAPGPTRILIVGDSVTHGSNGDYTWRYFSWKGLHGADFVGHRTELADGSSYADPDFDQDHSARWGMALLYMLDRPDEDNPRISDLMTRTDPDVVVMDLGFNDIRYYGFDQWMLDNVTRFVVEARSVNPDVKVVLGDLPQEWVQGIPAYDAALPGLAAQLSTPQSPVVATDVTSDFVRDVDTYDEAHPTTSGQWKIAAAMNVAFAQLGLDAGTPPGPATPPSNPPPTTEPPVVTPPAATPSSTTAAASAPGATTLRVRPARRGWVTLRWALVPSATATRVWFRDKTADGQWTVNYVDIAGGTTKHRQRFIAGHRMLFRVQAVNPAGASPFSNVVKATVRG
jgi:hypothetical protein